MASRNKVSSKAAKKPRVKTLKLKRETLKEVSGREKKKVKGGGGLASSVSAHPTDVRRT